MIPRCLGAKEAQPRAAGGAALDPAHTYQALPPTSPHTISFTSVLTAHVTQLSYNARYTNRQVAGTSVPVAKLNDAFRRRAWLSGGIRTPIPGWHWMLE